MGLSCDFCIRKWRSYTAKYLASLRYVLPQCHRLQQTYIPTTERTNDLFIMDLALASGAFTKSQLRILNYCRLYLHLSTVSEMFNVSGSHMLPHILKGNRPPWFDQTITITIQTRPSLHQWTKQWSQLCSILQPHGAQLGRWKRLPHPPRLRREAYFEAKTLYYWYTGSYWSATPHSTRGCFQLHERLEDWTPSRHARPVDIVARVCNTIYSD